MAAWVLSSVFSVLDPLESCLGLILSQRELSVLQDRTALVDGLPLFRVQLLQMLSLGPDLQLSLSSARD